MKSVFLPKDNNGHTVHAHGGQILRHNLCWYWIGENRLERNRVSCYKSDDLLHWQFCCHSLTLDAPTQKHPFVVTDLALEMTDSKGELRGCNIERPKVLYNAQTNTFVMWMHWEKPDDYSQARCAVAVSPSLEQPFTYLGSFNPIGHMSRDCTLFADDDGTAYFLSSARDNLDLHLYALSPDFLCIDRLVRVLWPGQQQEAPVLFKRQGHYYLLTSGCTGWAPNQSSFSQATQLDGAWHARRNLGDNTTYRSQPTWVLPVEKDGETTYWYIGDRWGGEGNYHLSEYVALPLSFEEDGQVLLQWTDDISFYEGVICDCFRPKRLWRVISPALPEGPQIA